MKVTVKILVVEDTDDDEMMLLDALRRAGFEVEHERVETAAEMTAALDRQEWDLVISDYNLPRFSGPEALDLLRSRGADTPFIIVSGTVGEEIAVEVMRRGANDYLMKSNYRRLGVAVERELRETVERRKRREMEVALARTQARLGQLLKHSPAVVYSQKLQGEELVTHLVSEGVRRLLDFSVTEATAAGWWASTIHPEDRQRVSRLAGLRAHGEERIEYRMRARDGSYRWVEDNRRLIQSGGHAGEVVGIWTDITERKQAERALEEYQLRLRLAIQATDIGPWDWKLQTNEVYFSPEWKRQLGHSDDELPNQLAEWEVRLHPDDRERILADVRGYLSGERPDYDVEFRLRHKDGSYRWIHTRALLERDEAGRPTRMVGCHVDITALKETEDRLREQASLLDKAQDAIIVRDIGHRITYWNRSAERIYGWTTQEACGKVSSDLLKLEPQAFAEACAALHERGEWAGELRKHAKDGRALQVEARWTLVRHADGTPKCILDISTDITEKKKLEQQFLRAQRMESIGTLAGGVAHDLNNVLAPILMSLQILKFKLAGADDQDLLTTLESGCQRGAALIRQVLCFARGVEGERIAVNPQHIMRELMQIMHDTFPKDVRTQFTPDRELWTITGDPTQIHQVLLNLCVNARDAMPNGGSLTITMGNVVLDETYSGMNLEAKPGPYVVITVADTGTGIPPAIQEKIFEPFFTTKEVGKGTGLGLSTTIAIVKSHRGFINLYSEEGKGTRFKVYLPANTSAAEAESVATAQTGLPRGHGELVLVVDDEEGIRRVAQHTLERFGYRALVASHGAEGVAIYAQRQREIALVLTDMAMPIMDGPTMIVALQAINPKVRIIATSGLTTNGEVAKVVGSGVTRFISKPYNAGALLQAVHEALNT